MALPPQLANKFQKKTDKPEGKLSPALAAAAKRRLASKSAAKVKGDGDADDVNGAAVSYAPGVVK